MTGRGPAGARNDRAISTLEALQKCPDSPSKRKYLTSADAAEAGIRRTRETGILIQPYACPGCGYFHLSRSTRTDRLVSSHDGLVLTAGMQKRELYPAKAPLPERKDMSEILAMERPIVPVNMAAREKIAREYLEGKVRVQTGEIMDLLGVGRGPASNVMNALGWHGKRGTTGGWYAPDYVAPEAEETPTGGFEVFKKPAKRKKKAAPPKKDLQLIALRGFLVGKDAVATAEVMEGLGVTEYKAKDLIKAEGWRYVGGTDRRYHRPETETATVAEVAAEPVIVAQAEPQATPILLASRRHPAIAEDPRVLAPAAADPWHTMEINEKLMGMSLQQICDAMDTFGFELRLQTKLPG